MSSDVNRTEPTAGRTVVYNIQYHPSSTDHPVIREKRRRLPCTNIELPIKKHRRRLLLYVQFEVNGTFQEYRWNHECHLSFEVPSKVAPHVALKISLCAKNEKVDLRLASKECVLASLVLPQMTTSIRLDICDARLTEGPIVEVTVAVQPLERATLEVVDALEKALTLPAKWDAMARYVKGVVQIGGAIAEINPIAKAVFTLLEMGVEELERRKDNINAIVSLVHELGEASAVVIAVDSQDFEGKRARQIRARDALVPMIFRALSYIQSLKRVDHVRTQTEDQVIKLQRALRKLVVDVKAGQEIDMQQALFRVEDMVEKLDIDNALRHLPSATVQFGSTKACLPGTRVEILGLIADWVFDPKGPRGFILHGTAGKGKSAVAHTVARWLTDMGVAASFFAFERTNRARRANQLLPTLARQLAYLDPQYYRQLRSLLPAQLETTDIHDQLEHLILSSFRNYAPLLPIVFVIDALDECPNIDVNEIEDRKALLNSLRTCMSNAQLHYNIRILITTRPEPETYYPLLEDSVSFMWKSIDGATDTAKDILRFVESELMSPIVRKIVGDLTSIVDIIASAAQDSFECAAVLCRELTGPQRPKTEAKRAVLIRRVQTQPGLPLYASYRTILEEHLDTDDHDLMALYRQTVGWVFAVREPQPRSVFQEIADTLPSQKDIFLVLEGLGSLLSGTSPSDTEPIRPLHTSFRDYVLDSEVSGVFAIASDFDAANSQLALACLGIMGRPKSGLRYNIRNLPSPFVSKEDIDDLDGRLTKQLSPGLQYACREVSTHLSHSQSGDPDPMPALQRFLQDQFFFWLEACGWLGYEPCDSLRNMLHWMEKLSKGELAAIITEFIAFEKRIREAISKSPPQVYVTGLLFAPVNSHVSRLYRPRIVSPINVSGYEREREWPPSEPLVIQVGGNVMALAYSPDGKEIAVGLLDGTLQLCDAETGRRVRGAMRGHKDAVFALAFSPDGSRIASGSSDHTVRLWDAKTGQQHGEVLRGHTRVVRSVAFSPDSTTVVSGSGDCTLRLWHVKTGKKANEALRGAVFPIAGVVFSSDGTRIISAHSDQAVYIWDSAAQRQLGHPLTHKGFAYATSAISRDGKYIAFGLWNGTVCVWDAEGRQQVWALQGHAYAIHAVAFSPDSTRIVSGGGDNTVRIWEAASGTQVGDDLRHTNGVNSVAFSPDGNHVVSGSVDGTIRVWDTREVKKEGGIPVGHTGAVTSIACSSDGKYIVSGSTDKTVRLWDAQTGQPVGEPMTGHNNYVNCVTFSPDSTRVASASNDRTVRVWDVTTRLLVGDALRGHDLGVICVAFSPDGARLLVVSGSAGNTLRLWHPVTGRQIGKQLCGHENYIRSVSFSSNGLCIASGSDDGSIRLWDAQLQLQIGKALKGHKDGVQSVAFSPNDALLASGSVDGTICLWDTHTGEQMGEPLTGHFGWVLSVSFSLDGKYVVSGSTDRTVRVWNVQTRQQVSVALQEHENDVMSVSFAADGKHIVSGSCDGTIRIWAFEDLQSLGDAVDAASAHTARALVQASLREDEGSWLVYDDNGTERPILWIPHHLRHIHRVYSPFHVQFVPPTIPQMHITLNDSFRLDQWPVYTPAPAAEESLEALGREE